MNFQDILQIVDFSALYQLAFTLYAAFIAIEYAKSFTSQVINHFYDFKSEIDAKIETIKMKCRKEELQNIESDDYFMNGDGLCLLLDYKDKVKSSEKHADDIAQTLKTQVDKNTEYRVFRHISIFMMLYCFTILLAGGIYRVFPFQTMHFLITFTVLAGLFVLAGWICAAKRLLLSWSEKRSLKLIGVLYVLFIILAFLSLLLHPDLTFAIKKCLWTGTMIVAVIVPFMNFLFFFFLVRIQMSIMRNGFDQSYNDLETECDNVGMLMGKLLNHQEMRNKVEKSKKTDETK